jgi:hypothetical protein
MLVARLLETGLNTLWLCVLVSSEQDDSLAKFCLFEDRWHLKANYLNFLLVSRIVGDITDLCKHTIVI